jgi:ABC-type uncharacterized transport system auxiliary subunit
MTIIRRRLWPLIICAMTLAGGCAIKPSPAPDIHYYTLAYPPPTVAAPLRLPVVLRLERFSAAPGYASDRMVYSDAAYRQNAYSYHHWQAQPADLTTYFLARDLKASGLFAAVTADGDSLKASHRLEATLDEFRETDTAGRCSASLAVTAVLVRENEPDITRRIVWQKAYRFSVACRERSPAALAEAMSGAMAELSRQLAADIHGALAVTPPPAG